MWNAVCIVYFKYGVSTSNSCARVGTLSDVDYITNNQTMTSSTYFAVVKSDGRVGSNLNVISQISTDVDNSVENVNTDDLVLAGTALLPPTTMPTQMSSMMLATLGRVI